MIRPEYTHKRDLTLKEWHRSFHAKCCLTDIDFVEYRYIDGKPKIVALLEDKHEKANIQYWMEHGYQVFIQLAKALNVPAYLVIHNCFENTPQEDWRFSVKNLITQEQRKFNANYFKKFIETLGTIENSLIWNQHNFNVA